MNLHFLNLLLRLLSVQQLIQFGVVITHALLSLMLDIIRFDSWVYRRNWPLFIIRHIVVVIIIIVVILARNRWFHPLLIIEIGTRLINTLISISISFSLVLFLCGIILVRSQHAVSLSCSSLSIHEHSPIYSLETTQHYCSNTPLIHS
jgi:peptidoglycan biosynthesis protein MviN/MurJ (putative lipid II flippase)